MVYLFSWFGLVFLIFLCWIAMRCAVRCAIHMGCATMIMWAIHIRCAIPCAIQYKVCYPKCSVLSRMRCAIQHEVCYPWGVLSRMRCALQNEVCYSAYCMFIFILHENGCPLSLSSVGALGLRTVWALGWRTVGSLGLRNRKTLCSLRVLYMVTTMFFLLCRWFCCSNNSWALYMDLMWHMPIGVSRDLTYLYFFLVFHGYSPLSL